MNEFKNVRILSMREETGIGKQDILRRKSSSWWKNLLEKVTLKLRPPLQSDWEKKTGLHWREWGKLQ
jgi:hypothetical protein